MGPTRGDVTRLLARWADGDRAALDALMPVVRGELRRIADAHLRSERIGRALQPTALVHEAWLRLQRQEQLDFDQRKQFYALAAQALRRVLVDLARAAAAYRRGGVTITALTGDDAADVDRTIDLLALDQALEQLAETSQRQASVIELRYFGGLAVEEMADVLGVSPATITREQRTAEAFLANDMSAPW